MIAFFDADTLCQAVTLTFARWPWKFAVHQASRDQSLYGIWAKSSNPGWIIDICANFAHFMSRCDVDLRPLDLLALNFYSTSVSYV